MFADAGSVDSFQLGGIVYHNMSFNHHKKIQIGEESKGTSGKKQSIKCGNGLSEQLLFTSRSGHPSDCWKHFPCLSVWCQKSKACFCWLEQTILKTWELSGFLNCIELTRERDQPWCVLYSACWHYYSQSFALLIKKLTHFLKKNYNLAKQVCWRRIGRESTV